MLNRAVNPAASVARSGHGARLSSTESEQAVTRQRQRTPLGKLTRTFVRARDGVWVHRPLFKRLGGIAPAALLSQILYWFDEGEGSECRARLTFPGDERPWLAKSFGDWFDECGVTEKQARRIIEQFEAEGLVETRLRRFNGAPTTHLTLDFRAIEALIDGLLEDDDPKMGIVPICPQGESDLPSGQNGSALRANGIAPKGRSTTELSIRPTERAAEPSLFEGEPAAEELVAPAAPSQGAERSRGRKRDHLWDALTEAIGVDMGSLTPSARGELNGHLRTLKNLPTPATPETIRARAEDYALLHAGRLPTAKALVAEWPTLERQAAAKRKADAEMDAKRASWGRGRGQQGPAASEPAEDGTVYEAVSIVPHGANMIRLEDGHVPIYPRVDVSVACRVDDDGDLVPLSPAKDGFSNEAKALQAVWNRWCRRKGIPTWLLPGAMWWGQENLEWITERYPALSQADWVSATRIELGLCPWSAGEPDWPGVDFTPDVAALVKREREARMAPEWLDGALEWWLDLLRSIDHLPRSADGAGPTTERGWPEMAPPECWEAAGLRTWDA